MRNDDPGYIATCPNCGGPCATVPSTNLSTPPWLCQRCVRGWFQTEIDVAEHAHPDLFWDPATHAFTGEVDLSIEQTIIEGRGMSCSQAQLDANPDLVLDMEITAEITGMPMPMPMVQPVDDTPAQLAQPDSTDEAAP